MCPRPFLDKEQALGSDGVGGVAVSLLVVLHCCWWACAVVGGVVALLPVGLHCRWRGGCVVAGVVSLLSWE